MASKPMKVDIVNLNCAGIYVGNKSHFVAIAQRLEDVKEFGVYADDLRAICLHLEENGITTVAMESTGNYSQNLFVELQKHGMKVTLCNGKFTKNAYGKKTDVKDCGWIQKLSLLGMLTGSFLPDNVTEELRTY